MSYQADEPHRPWHLKRNSWILAAVFVCLLTAGLGIVSYIGMSKIPNVGGGLTLEADPDTRIYIGDKFVGTEQVSFTWTKLLGDEGHPPVAVELPYPSGTASAETISGPGAKTLVSEGGSSTGLMQARVSSERFLIRRADGTLDQVFAIILDCDLDRPPARRYLVPIRLRRGTPASVYFSEGGLSTSASSGPGFMKAFGRSPAEIKINRKFVPTAPPGQFAEEIKTKGLWEPGTSQE
jgi:hypothetical protein